MDISDNFSATVLKGKKLMRLPVGLSDYQVPHLENGFSPKGGNLCASF